MEKLFLKIILESYILIKEALVCSHKRFAWRIIQSVKTRLGRANQIWRLMQSFIRNHDQSKYYPPQSLTY